MQKQRDLYWSAKGKFNSFIGIWHPSGKLELEYWADTYTCHVTLRKKTKVPSEAHEYFKELLHKIEEFPSVSHWLGNDLKAEKKYD